MTCEHCEDWGRTITHEENCAAIPCPECGRLTWPNLGVNCPAGMDWAIAAAMNRMQTLNILGYPVERKA